MKLYLALNGATHDAAVCAWGLKGHYDYVRPITAIRYMASLGQSSDPGLPSYHEHGLPLQPGLAELITAASAAPGERHAHLAEHVGEIAVYSWLGTPEEDTEYTGVDWILGVDWVPYQRDTFVTPPFAGYISGHSTFSRAARGGDGALHRQRVLPPAASASSWRRRTSSWCSRRGRARPSSCSGPPTTTPPTRRASRACTAASTLTWTTCPGRRIGSRIGKDAFRRALAYFDGSAGG